jgi:hypothetical protein
MSKTKSPPAPAPVRETRPSDSQPEAPAGRAADGKFCAGNTFARGNPFGRKLAAMRQAFIEAVTDDDIQAIAAVLIQKAREGDVAAAKLVLQYAIGKPAPVQEPDRLEIEEWNLRQEASLGGDDIMGTLNAATTAQGNVIVGIAQPTLHKELWAPFVKEALGQAPPGSAKKTYDDQLRAEVEADDYGGPLPPDFDDDAAAGGDWTAGPLRTASYGAQ